MAPWRHKLLNDRPTGRAKQVAEGSLAVLGILAGFEIQNGRAVGFLAGQLMHDMVAVAGEKAQGQQVFIVIEGRADVPPPTQPICDHESVKRVALVHVHVTLLEIGRQPWIEQEQLLRPGLKRRLVAQALEQVKPVPARRLRRQTQFAETLGFHNPSDFLDQGLCPWTVVVQGAARDDFPTILCHQTIGVGLAVDVHPAD